MLDFASRLHNFVMALQKKAEEDIDKIIEEYASKVKLFQRQAHGFIETSSKFSRSGGAKIDNIDFCAT
jgi:hypothetical protein